MTGDRSRGLRIDPKDTIFPVYGGRYQGFDFGEDMQNIVTYEHHGKTYSATYTLAKKIVKTTSDFGTRAAPMGKDPAASVARWSLGEMVRAADDLRRAG